MTSEFSLTDMATFDNDASACFDRIIMLLAVLRARQIGMPKSAGEMLLELQETAKYHIKTNAGISTESYTTDEQWKYTEAHKGAQILAVNGSSSQP